MKPRHVLMGIALVLAGVLAAFGDTTPDTEVVEATAPSKPSASAPGLSRDKQALPRERRVGVLRVIPRDALIGEGVHDGTDDQDLFARRDWTPPPPPAAPEPVMVAPPPPPPAAPPLPFRVVGKAVTEHGWQVFLSQGERLHIAREKDVIDGIYRVESIRPPQLVLTYLPLNEAQQLNIGVFD